MSRGSADKSADRVMAMGEKILAEMRLAKARDARMMRMLRAIEMNLSGEAGEARPWRAKLSKVKSEQVDRVCEYLVWNPKASIKTACAQTWRYAKGGYRLSGLRDRCYKLCLPKYAKKELLDLSERSPEEARAADRRSR